MSEWFKEHAWKVCIGLKLIAGSNPALSAEKSNHKVAFLFFITYIYPMENQPKNSYFKMGYVAIVLISMGYLSFDYLQNPKESSAFTLILLLVLVSTNKLFNPKASR